jgi:uncharacterized damage-inducible protein DinB
MNLQFAFEVNRQTRKNILRTIDGLTEEEINIIPDGFKNNIAWNLGHILITQQLLFYTMSGNKPLVSKELIEKYKKSSRPTENISMEEFDSIRELYTTSINKAEEDYNAGLFAGYQPYQTSYGIYINNIEDVIQFIFAHDAFHWGVMASMRKLV